MTEVAFIKNLLEANWSTSISNRSNDVPQPSFTLEKEERQQRLRSQDVGYVASGGDTEYALQGFGATHERVDTTIVIEYRAATRSASTGLDDGYDRLFGTRTGTDGLQAPDRWSGIVGETRRVLLADRKGRAEWDIIGDAIRVADNTDLGGTNYWRADVFVPLKNFADSIDTST